MAGTRFRNGIKVPVGGLRIGTEGSETAINATALELNKLSGLTPSTADLNKVYGISAGAPISGSQFAVTYPNFAAADVAKTFFVAPAACKVKEISERHVTVAGQAGVLTIEKLTAGEAPAAGDDLITTGFDMTSTANTAVTKMAVTTAAATLAVGNALCLKLQSGNAASYALGTLTVLMEWV